MVAVSVADALPRRCGLKLTTMAQLPPGRTGVGHVVADSLKSLFDTFDRCAPCKVSGTVEVFVMVADALPTALSATLPALAPVRVKVGAVPWPRRMVSFEADFVVAPFALCSANRTVSVEARSPLAFGWNTTAMSHWAPGARAPVQVPCDAWYSAPCAPVGLAAT